MTILLIISCVGLTGLTLWMIVKILNSIKDNEEIEARRTKYKGMD